VSTFVIPLKEKAMECYSLKGRVFESPTLMDLEKLFAYPFRIFFTNLLCFSDSEGRFEWKKEILMEKILPLDASKSLDTMEALNVLRMYRMIIMYSENGNYYGQILNLNAYIVQYGRKKTSKIPVPRLKNELSREEKLQLNNKKTLVLSDVYEFASRKAMKIKKKHLYRFYLIIRIFIFGEKHRLTKKMNDQSFPFIRKNRRWAKAISNIYNIYINNIYNNIIYNNNNTYPPNRVFGDKEDKGMSSNWKEGFEAWWKAYPKKLEKAKCRQVYQKINPSEELALVMLKALKAQVLEAGLKQKYGAFVPEWIYPVRWLQRERWEDAVNLDEAYWRSESGRNEKAPVYAPVKEFELEEMEGRPQRTAETERIIAEARKMVKSAPR